MMQSGNLFVMTMNNPVRWIDPTGLFAIPPWLQPGGGLQLGPQLGPSGAIWDAIRQISSPLMYDPKALDSKNELNKQGAQGKPKVKVGNTTGPSPGGGGGHTGAGGVAPDDGRTGSVPRPQAPNNIINSTANPRHATAAQNAVNTATSTNPTLADVIRGATHTRSTRGNTPSGWHAHNFTSQGGNAAAQKHFDSLNPTNVQQGPDGKHGNLRGGLQVNIHPGRYAGGATTLEIYNPATRERIKIRFYE